MSSLLEIAGGINRCGCSKNNTVRLVTFQSRDVTSKLLGAGVIETLVPFSSNYIPHRLSHVETELQFVKIDSGIIALKDGDKDKYYEIHKSKIKERVYPFYAYKTHDYCGEPRNMSVATIYNLSSHFMGAMNFAERDIIELEVPVEYVTVEREKDSYVECLLPVMKKEWVVSILKFNRWISEACHKENALLYDNVVLREDTYRMCYSKDVVFNGHGKGDFLQCCLSSQMLKKVSDISIQRDYVQTHVFNAFVRYMSMIRYSLTIEDFTNIKQRHALTEMADTVDVKYIDSFTSKMNQLLRLVGREVYPTNNSYKERLQFLREADKDYSFEEEEEY